MKAIAWLSLIVTLSIPAAAQIDPQIAHVAQGQGWSTVIRAMNICDENAQFWIDFYRKNGRPLPIFFEGAEPDRRHASIASGLRPGEIQKYTMINTGDELIQGFGEVTANDGYSNRSQCVSFEIEYWQHLPIGQKRIATIPVVLDSPIRSARRSTLTFSFVNRENCTTGIALAGIQSFSGETVTLEARARHGQILERADLGVVNYAAFPLHEHLPVTKTYSEQDGMGTIRISGADSAVALDFCDGKLEQFRLPHRNKHGN